MSLALTSFCLTHTHTHNDCESLHDCHGGRRRLLKSASQTTLLIDRLSRYWDGKASSRDERLTGISEARVQLQDFVDGDRTSVRYLCRRSASVNPLIRWSEVVDPKTRRLPKSDDTEAEIVVAVEVNVVASWSVALERRMGGRALVRSCHLNPRDVLIGRDSQCREDRGSLERLTDTILNLLS